MPLVIALRLPDVVLVGTDGRVLRRTLVEGTASPALLELWRGEFSDEPTGRILLLEGAAWDPPLRLFAAQARRAGHRVEGAWTAGWAIEENEDALVLADRLIQAALQHDPGGPENLLGGRRWHLPEVLAGRRGRVLFSAFAVLALVATAGLLVAARTRHAAQTAAQAAAAALESAAQAAGLRHRSSQALDLALWQAVAPPRPWAHDLLLALASAAGNRFVLEGLEVDGDRATTLIAAEGPSEAWAGALARRLQAEGMAVAAADKGGEVEIRLLRPPSPPDPEELASAAAAALARLPAGIVADRLVAAAAGSWIVTADPRPMATARFYRMRRYAFVPRDPSRAAWPLLLALTSRLAETDGVTIDRIHATGASGASGDFAQLALEATFRTRP